MIFLKKEKKWYQKISNWLTIVAVVILAFVLLINLWIMFQANTDKDKVPSVFGYKPFIVLSGSMETDIRVGDLIITREVDPTTLVIGDVVAFRDPEGTVTTHRIIEIVDCRGSNCFITKGDNNSSQDQQLVELSDVEGIYIGRIPGVGNMLKSMSEPTTIIIVVLCITVIFAASFMLSNKKQISQEQLEFLEYKRKKEQEEKSKEDAEFLEFKKQKALKEQEEREKENQEFLEYKKQKAIKEEQPKNDEQPKNKNRNNNYKNNNKGNYNKNNRNNNYNQNKKESSKSEKKTTPKNKTNN